MTAVEWLEQEIDKVWKGDIMYMELSRNIYYRLLEQAKAMEMEQITKAFADGQETPINNPTTPHYSNEEYYNDTYKK